MQADSSQTKRRKLTVVRQVVNHAPDKAIVKVTKSGKVLSGVKGAKAAPSSQVENRSRASSRVIITEKAKKRPLSVTIRSIDRQEEESEQKRRVVSVKSPSSTGVRNNRRLFGSILQGETKSPEKANHKREEGGRKVFWLHVLHDIYLYCVPRYTNIRPFSSNPAHFTYC